VAFWVVIDEDVGPEVRLAAEVNFPSGRNETAWVKAPQLLAESQALTL